MSTLWFYIVAVMVAVYVVLDGFDFGAGILHLFVAKTDAERRSVFAAIGPYWDGNEVWLLAGGGALVFAFPKAYAAGFSGFYLPLTLVLWLLMLRGLSIEFRSKEPSPLWRSFWDGGFFLSSLLMAVILGAAVGNVVRGVPLSAEGYFAGPLFTSFMPDKNPGVLDWYTVTLGLFATSVLALHGALFLRWKLDGPVHDRATALSKALWGAVVLLGVVATVETQMVRPDLFSAVLSRPFALLLAVVFVVCLGAVPALLKKANQLMPFLATGVFIATMLASTAVAVFPVLLRSTVDPANNITADNAHTSAIAMQFATPVWFVAILIAVGYFVFLFRSFRGKVNVEESHGY